MTDIFLSYSRVDLAFVEKLYDRIQRMRPNDKIWYDKAPRGLLGGDSWWDEILDAIANADIFIYVLSNESVQSDYCQAEFEEARRLQKRIITIQARDRTKLTNELRDIQYVDMKNGVDDPEALVSLSGALDRQISLIQKKRALWRPRTPKPTDEKPITHDASAPDIDTPTLQAPVPDKPQSDSNIKVAYIGGALLIASVIIAGLFGLWQGISANSSLQPIVQTQSTEILAEVQSENPITDTPRQELTEVSATIVTSLPHSDAPQLSTPGFVQHEVQVIWDANSLSIIIKNAGVVNLEQLTFRLPSIDFAENDIKFKELSLELVYPISNIISPICFHFYIDGGSDAPRDCLSVEPEGFVSYERFGNVADAFWLTDCISAVCSARSNIAFYDYKEDGSLVLKPDIICSSNSDCTFLYPFKESS